VLGSGQQPNDLLDQRDLLLDRLAKSAAGLVRAAEWPGIGLDRRPCSGDCQLYFTLNFAGNAGEKAVDVYPGQTAW
jgi:hypothetical protein